MSPISYIKNRNEITIDIIQKDGSKKTLRTQYKRSALILSTSKENYQRLMDIHQNTTLGELEVLNNTTLRSLDSYDDHVLLPRSRIKDRIGGKKKYVLISED